MQKTGPFARHGMATASWLVLVLAVGAGCDTRFHYRLLYEIEPYNTHTRIGWHQGGVTSLAFAPSGRILAAASNTGRVGIWDAASGRSVRTFTAHDGAIVALDFTPDGKQLVSVGVDGAVKVWDASSGTCREAFNAGYECSGMAISPDGKALALSFFAKRAAFVGSSSMFDRIVNVPGAVNVSFSVDGRLVVSGWGTKVELWDARTAQRVRTLKTEYLVKSVSFLSDGKRLVAGGNTRPEDAPVADVLAIWEVDTGRRVGIGDSQSAEFDEGIRTIHALADARYVVCIDGSGRPSVLDLTTLQQTEIRGGSDRDYGALAATPDGTRIAHGGSGILRSFLVGTSIYVWERHAGRYSGPLSQGDDGVELYRAEPE